MVYYLGPFPPEYGGATVKNQYLFEALGSEIPIRRVDFGKIKRGSLRELGRLLAALCRRDSRFLLGASSRKSRKWLTGLLYLFRRGAMGRSALVLMGGASAGDIAKSPRYRTWAAAYRSIYVETEPMREVLETAGLANAALYPNARPRPTGEREDRDGPLRCVFFSLIQPGKGADLALEAAARLPQVQFTFYGRVEPSFRRAFFAAADRLDNVRYAGEVRETGQGVYEVLRRQDVLLLPTRWACEGVPGALVEGKFAGLAEIVSDTACNRNIVGSSGLVLAENTGAALAEAIETLDRDRASLRRMQAESRRSAEEYAMERWLPGVLRALDAP